MADPIKNSYPRDAFLHLLAIVTLYYSVVSLLTLFFQTINAIFPDPLSYFDQGGQLRWAIASLIVIFPVFLWASWFLHKDTIFNPEKAEFKIRRWLGYLTVFLAAGLVIGDLVILVLNFLEGDLTLRFVLKVLAVLAVAASVFGYYLYDLRRTPGVLAPRARLFVWVVIIAVAVAIVGGFFVAGSPFKQREVRFDSQRVGHLQTIQWQIVNHWQQKGVLPKTLDDLTDTISGFKAPVDPKSQIVYDYKVTGSQSFELCAIFTRSSKDSYLRGTEPMPAQYGIDDNWEHGVGQQCFARTIDPDLYPPRPSKPIQL